jgi:hypothetical protein
VSDARDLMRLHVEALFTLDHAGPFIARLARDEPVHRTWAGPAYRFPADPSGEETAVRVTPDNASLLSPRTGVPMSRPVFR